MYTVPQSRSTIYLGRRIDDEGIEADRYRRYRQLIQSVWAKSRARTLYFSIVFRCDIMSYIYRLDQLYAFPSVPSSSILRPNLHPNLSYTYIMIFIIFSPGTDSSLCGTYQQAPVLCQGPTGMLNLHILEQRP